MRDTRPEGVGTKRAGANAPDADAAAGYPQTTPVTPGPAKPRRTSRTPPAASAAVTPATKPPPSDDELRRWKRCCWGTCAFCRAGGTADAPAEPDPAGRVAAVRKGIGDRLARSGPGSKAARFLRGLLVLVEAEAARTRPPGRPPP